MAKSNEPIARAIKPPAMENKSDREKKVRSHIYSRPLSDRSRFVCSDEISKLWQEWHYLLHGCQPTVWKGKKPSLPNDAIELIDNDVFLSRMPFWIMMINKGWAPLVMITIRRSILWRPSGIYLNIPGRWHRVDLPSAFLYNIVSF